MRSTSRTTRFSAQAADSAAPTATIITTAPSTRSALAAASPRQTEPASAYG